METATKNLDEAVADAALATVSKPRRIKRPIEEVDREERTRLRRLKWCEEARTAINNAVTGGEPETTWYINEDGTTNIDKVMEDLAPASYRQPLASEPLARRTRDEFVQYDKYVRGDGNYARDLYYDSQNDRYYVMDDFVKSKSASKRKPKAEKGAA